MSVDWENHFPLVTAHFITRIGSDHNPLLVEGCPTRSVRSTIFRFEKSWIQQEGFMDWVLGKWPDKQSRIGIDAWQLISSKLRSSLRGWNGNWGSDMKNCYC